MAPPSRRGDAPLSEEIFGRPSRFQFLQLVRLLRKHRSDRGTVGREVDPEDEFVRFRSDVSYGFPTGDVRSLESPEAGDDGRTPPPDELTVNFFGVATPNSFGSLPTPYAEEIRSRARERNHAPRDFIDLFNHRLLSLFYRAWAQARPDVLYDVGEESPYESALHAVMGLQADALRDRLPLDSRDLLSRAGLISMRPAPAVAVASLVESFIGIPATVEQFLPAWYEIDREDRTRLGRSNTRLGHDVSLGSETCLAQWRFRIRAGPMDFGTYRRLLPDGQTFDALAATIRLALGPEFDFELNLVLSHEEVPRLALGVDENCRLGWSTWLAQGEDARDADQAIFVPNLDHEDQRASMEALR